MTSARRTGTPPVATYGGNEMSESPAEIEVVNAYRWMGDPRFGKFHVYVDGAKVGVAPLSGSLQTPVDPGEHWVRVRLWWYRSPSLQVGLAAGETLRLQGDIPRDLPVWKRMIRMLLHPGNSLTLRA
jgi:hypothetical protein